MRSSNATVAVNAGATLDLNSNFPTIGAITGTGGTVTNLTAGSNAVSQYAPPIASMFNDVARTPPEFLLWFHHLPWDAPMPSGRTLWDELALHYASGVESVRAMRATWAGLAPYVDAQRHAEVQTFLRIQEEEAQWWRDATLAYFQSLSHRPLPAGVPAPARTLSEYEAIAVPYAPGNPGWTAAPFRH